MRFDELDRDDIRALQERMISLGFNPGRADGVWGPLTAAAYDAYLVTRNVEISVPMMAPSAAKPWWTSKGIWGPIITLSAVVAGAFGIAFDAKEATDALMPMVEVLPLVVAALGGIMAWWGRKTAKAQIDPDLVLPGVRLSRGLRQPGRSPAPRAVPPDDDDEAGYWGSDRGPFGPE